MPSGRLTSWALYPNQRYPAALQGSLGQSFLHQGTPMPVIYRDPWWKIEDPDHRDGLQRQYDREIGAEHILWGAGGVVVGKCDSNDDVLVALSEGRFAIVHLIWTSNPGGATWPTTAIYDSAVAISAAIAEDHDSYR
jgi:hypothetical protein